MTADSSTCHPGSLLVLAFRRPNVGDDTPAFSTWKTIKYALAGIRCPACEWRPEASSRWTCWDCDDPEYFYGGCGAVWNTFETRGRCLTCLHQWKWTNCLACHAWSRHDDWYE